MTEGLDIPDGFSVECWALISVPRRPRWPDHQRRIRWRHLRTLLEYGIPMRDLLDTGTCAFRFGVVTIRGRELIFTDDPRLRAWLHGPGLFKFPAVPVDEEGISL